MALTHCCGCFHMRSGVKAMGIIFAVLSGIGLGVGLWISFAMNPTGWAYVVPSAVNIAINVMLAVGCHKEKRVLFIPWMVLGMIGIVVSYIGSLVMLGFGITGVVIGDRLNEDYRLPSNNWQDELQRTMNHAVRPNSERMSEIGFIGETMGIGFIVGGIVSIVWNSIFVYLWAVVKTLYLSMGKGPDHIRLVEEHDYRDNVENFKV